MPHQPDRALSESQNSPPLRDLRDATAEMILNARGPYRVEAHAHPHFELIYVLRGTRMLRMGGRSYRARSGDLLVFRPGEVHEEWSGSKQISYFVIRFEQQDLASAKIGFPSTDRIGPVIRLTSRERFIELFSRMREEQKAPKSDSDLMLGAYLVEFVVLLGRAVDEVLAERIPEASVPQTRIRTAIDTIRRNLGRHLELEELARTSFMSVSHFSHVFKSEVGISPKRFLIQERIDKAKDLLANTQKSAQEISRLLGYESPYFFYRQFKQQTSLTTTAYREQNSR